MTEPRENSQDLRDALLDRALASYTPATPREGFQVRLQARLTAESEPPRRPSFSMQWAWATPAIVATALAVAAILLFRPIPVPLKRQPSPTTSAARANTGGDTDAVSVRPHQSGAAAQAKRAAHGKRPVKATELASLRQMRTVSHPAPEEPLTREEKLLLRIVQKGDSQQMAMLNPQVREKQEAESEAEFKKFVEQSTTGERE
jgi:hypothetical protein